MVSHDAVEAVLLPDHDDCLGYPQEQCCSDVQTSADCESDPTIKKATTWEDVQRYWCHDWDRQFNVLAKANFTEHKYFLPEMFHIIDGI